MSLLDASEILKFIISYFINHREHLLKGAYMKLKKAIS